jgi:hypothetical protein
MSGMANEERINISEEDLEEIRALISNQVDEADQEFQRRSRRGRTDRDVPELWRSYYYLRQGYHIASAKRTRSQHWQGGPVQHRGAVCGICHRPLLLVWDIKCNDARFRRESLHVFAGMQRLPLYYCFHCPEPTIYRCGKANRIDVLPTERQSSEESPFANVPPQLPRRPLFLQAIPSPIENLIALSESLGFGWLRSQDRTILARYFGKPSKHFPGPRRSQFGGLPVLQQGHEDIPCPNARCPTHKWGHPIIRNKRYYYLKELAVIDGDAGLDMETHFAQIVFRICWACHLVHGKYQID